MTTNLFFSDQLSSNDIRSQLEADLHLLFTGDCTWSRGWYFSARRSTNLQRCTENSANCLFFSCKRIKIC